jgi:hypothetical protein
MINRRCVGEITMDNRKIASRLLFLAKEVLGMDFPTQDALDKYLKDHPDADRSNHKVVKTKKDTPAKKQDAPAPSDRKRTRWNPNNPIHKARNVSEGRSSTGENWKKVFLENADADLKESNHIFHKILLSLDTDSDDGKEFGRSYVKAMSQGVGDTAELSKKHETFLKKFATSPSANPAVAAAAKKRIEYEEGEIKKLKGLDLKDVDVSSPDAAWEYIVSNNLKGFSADDVMNRDHNVTRAEDEVAIIKKFFGKK